MPCSLKPVWRSEWLSTTTAALRLLASASMTKTRLIPAAIFIIVFVCTAAFAITKYSDAQVQTTCPAGTELAADGTSCLSPAVDDNVTTTASCIQGVLSDDGQTCVVPRIDADPAPVAAPIEAPIPTFTG